MSCRRRIASDSPVEAIQDLRDVLRPIRAVVEGNHVGENVGVVEGLGSGSLVCGRNLEMFANERPVGVL